MKSTYILIDTTLIGTPANTPWMKKRRSPSWIAALYSRQAISASPVLIDIERAQICGRIDEVMSLVNAVQPQLGISFIETELTLAELCSHLKQFIYIKREDGTELTLRFADCAVLDPLSAVLTAEQWCAMAQPIISWKIHGRDGKLKQLPPASVKTFANSPFLLSDQQIAALKSAMATDQLLADLRLMRPSSSLYSTFQSFEYVDRARRMWLAAGRAACTDLILFARSAVETEGRLLNVPSLPLILEQPDILHVRKELQRIMGTLR